MRKKKFSRKALIEFFANEFNLSIKFVRKKGKRMKHWLNINVRKQLLVKKKRRNMPPDKRWKLVKTPM